MKNEAIERENSCHTYTLIRSCKHTHTCYLELGSSRNTSAKLLPAAKRGG